MNHAIWPEGLPERAFHTTSALRAFLELTRQQFAWTLPLPQARRIRHARCEHGPLDPSAMETGLMLAGAIPPPGGWPRVVPDARTEAAFRAADAEPGDGVHIHTHSVI